MRTHGCLIGIVSIFFLLGVGGCRTFTRLFEGTPTATISATMKASINPGVGPYCLKINKIILCDGTDKYLALGEITKHSGEMVKEQHLEDTVTFIGPIKPIQYFLVLSKEVQQELKNHLAPHPYPVIESGDEMNEKSPQPSQTSVAPTSNKERSSVGDCAIYFIRQ